MTGYVDGSVLNGDRELIISLNKVGFFEIIIFGFFE